MVECGYNTIDHSDNGGQLYGHGNECSGLYGCLSGNSSNGQRNSCNTNDHSRWQYHLLCRWQCDTDLRSGQQLFMVECGDDTIHYSNYSRQLYGNGNKCIGLYGNIISDNSNSKFKSHYTNDYTGQQYHIL